jgi:hypothetical protein
MRYLMPALALTLALSAAPPAVAETPNDAALRAQGRREVDVPPQILGGMFEGQFLYLDGRAPGAFTISLEPDGPRRWKGMVRDQGGPQAKVVATWDGLVFQMSKQYAAPRPEGYEEWVFYIGTLKYEPITGEAMVIGTWSVPGDIDAFGFFVIPLGR